MSDTLKKVLILGPDLDISKEIETLCDREGYLLIGGGDIYISKEEITEKLSGKIDKNTEILIYGHGSAVGGTHYISLLSNFWESSDETKKVFSLLGSLAQDTPLNIKVNSCYGGASVKDVDVLPIGSSVIAFGPEDASVLAGSVNRVIGKSLEREPTNSTLFNIMDAFKYGTSQTLTFGIHLERGAIEKFSIRPPIHALLSLEEVNKYFQYQHGEVYERLVELNEENLLPQGALSLPPLVMQTDITEEDLVQLRQDWFAFEFGSRSGVYEEGQLRPFFEADKSLEATALMMVAKEGKIGAMEYLVGEGVDIDQSFYGHTTLTLAANCGHVEMVRRLVKDFGVDINQTVPYGWSALTAAVENGHLELVNVLIDELGADVHQKDGNGNTAVMSAVKNHQGEIVMKLTGETDTTKLKDLMSPLARSAYRHGATFEYLSALYDTDHDKFKALVNWDMLIFYDSKYDSKFAFDDFAKMYETDREKFKLFTDIRVRVLCSWDDVKFGNLKEFNIEQIKEIIQLEDIEKKRAFVSPGVLKAYKEGINFEELSNIYDSNREKFKALVSEDASRAYKAGIKFEWLSQIEDVGKVKALVSYDASRAYKTGIKFEWLNQIEDVGKLEALVSYDAREAYEAGIKFEWLSQIEDVGKIKALASYDARDAYKAGVKFEWLNQIEDVGKIKALVSYDAIRAYEAGIKFEWLSQIEDVEKIEALVSDDALNAYGSDIEFDQLSQIKDVERIKVLISWDALRAYRNGADFEGLSQVEDVEKIKALVSENARLAYNHGANFDKLVEIDSVEKIEILVSYDAIVTYANDVEFDQLISVEDTNKLIALISDGARAAYRAGAEFNDLSKIYDTDKDKFDVLTADNAGRAYMQVKFNDLVDLDVEQTKKVIEDSVEELRKWFPIKAEYKGLDKLEIDSVKIKGTSKVDGISKLVMVAAQGDLKEVKELAKDLGSNINESNAKGWNALTAATYYGHGDVVKELVEHFGANINQEDDNGNTAITIAVSPCEEDVLKVAGEHKDVGKSSDK